MKRMALANDFHMLFPDIPFEPDFAWAGTLAETEDGLPFIGSYDNPRVHCVMGYFRVRKPHQNSVNYHLLQPSQWKWFRYGYFYPFGEAY
jgi:hypothetical protein